MTVLNSHDKICLGIYGNVNVEVSTDEAGNVLRLGIYDSQRNRTTDVELSKAIEKHNYCELRSAIQLLYRKLTTLPDNSGYTMERSGNTVYMKRKDTRLDSNTTIKGDTVEIATGRTVKHASSADRPSTEERDPYNPQENAILVAKPEQYLNKKDNKPKPAASTVPENKKAVRRKAGNTLPSYGTNK